VQDIVIPYGMENKLFFIFLFFFYSESSPTSSPCKNSDFSVDALPFAYLPNLTLILGLIPFFKAKVKKKHL
jgi:hypothetical protein